MATSKYNIPLSYAEYNVGVFITNQMTSDPGGKSSCCYIQPSLWLRICFCIASLFVMNVGN